jgi:hypothetical protein
MYFADIAATSWDVDLGCAWCARPSIPNGLCKDNLQRYIEAMAALPLPPLELLSVQASIADAIASVPRPKGVRLRSFLLDEDHSGDPSIHVTFAVSKSIELTKAAVQELNSFGYAVSDAIDQLQTGRLPYVTFK